MHAEFQSTAHPKAGGNRHDDRHRHESRPVSIHRPPEGRRKPPARSAAGLPERFQSTAHPKAGGNAWPATRSAFPPRFNPPPTRRQAETRRRCGRDRHGAVSIHRPPEGRRKRMSSSSRCSSKLFQSTAHPKAGGNLWRSGSTSTLTGFNPPPTRRQAETAVFAAGRAGRDRFNPPPTRRQAETPRGPDPRRLSPVSIHRPPEGRRKPIQAEIDRRQAFQSTAHPKAGGNEPRGAQERQNEQFQSTAHPKAGGNLKRSGSALGRSGFNPPPTRRQAETCPAGARRWPWKGFNPPPTRRQAETSPETPPPTNYRSFNPPPTRRQAETGGR